MCPFNTRPEILEPSQMITYLIHTDAKKYAMYVFVI